MVLKIKSDLTIVIVNQSSCSLQSSFQYSTYEGDFVSAINFDGTVYKVPYTLIEPNKDEYQNERLTFNNDTYHKTIYNIPSLPADASTKTYTLKAVNGVLTWVEG